MHPALNTFEPIDAPLVRREISVAKGVQGAPEPEKTPEDAPAIVPSSDAAEIRHLAERALVNDPLNARAFRILGQLSQNSSSVAETETLMQASARRSLFETLAVYWIMRKKYQDGDYRSAIRYAEALLQSRPEFSQLSLPLFGKIAETPEASWRAEADARYKSTMEISVLQLSSAEHLRRTDTTRYPALSKEYAEPADYRRAQTLYSIPHCSRILRPRLLHLAAISASGAVKPGRQSF